MVPRQFTPGEYLARKGEAADTLFVIKEGKVRVLGLDQGQSTYEDFELGPGEHFGERVLLRDEPIPAHFITKTNGMALAIDKKSFCRTLGNFSKLISKAQDKKILVSWMTSLVFCLCTWLASDPPNLQILSLQSDCLKIAI
jgi:CRP-like cAMP-binding protein